MCLILRYAAILLAPTFSVTHIHIPHTMLRPPSGKAGLLPHEHPHSATVHLPLQGEAIRSRFHCELKLFSCFSVCSWRRDGFLLPTWNWNGFADDALTESFSRHQSENNDQQMFSDFWFPVGNKEPSSICYQFVGTLYTGSTVQLVVGFEHKS